MNRLTRWTALALATLATPLLGCNTSTEGENNLVRFTYEDPSAPLGASLDRAIAVGTRATLDVQSLDATTGIRVRGAKIAPPDVANVVDTDINTLIIEGLSPGEAELTIETDRGTDIGTLRVAEAATVGVAAIIETEKVLIGGTELLLVERRDSAGDKLVGIGPAELAISPETAAERVPSDDDSEFRLRYLEAGGKTLQIGDSTVPREVVSPEAVTTFDFASALQDAELATGGELPGLVTVEDAAGQPIGAVEGVLTVQSLTPGICAVRFQRQLYLPGIQVEGVSAGECVLEGTLGAQTAQVSLTVAD